MSRSDLPYSIRLTSDGFSTTRGFDTALQETGERIAATLLDKAENLRRTDFDRLSVSAIIDIISSTKSRRRLEPFFFNFRRRVYQDWSDTRTSKSRKDEEDPGRSLHSGIVIRSISLSRNSRFLYFLKRVRRAELRSEGDTHVQKHLLKQVSDDEDIRKERIVRNVHRELWDFVILTVYPHYPSIIVGSEN